MNKSYVFLQEVSDRTLKWTTKLKVLRDSGPCSSKDGKTTYRRLTLTDEKGTTIQASIFGDDDIPAFSHTLQLGKVYYISRAYLSKIKPQFKSAIDTEHQFQMTIKKYTRVEEAETPDFNSLTKKTTFLPLRDLSSISVGHEYIDIVAVVLDVSPEENRKRKHDGTDISFRDIRLTDSSLLPISLSTWGRFVHNECDALHQLLGSRPIIVATNLQAKEIYGRKILSTTSATDILINPETSKATDLAAWKLNFKNELDSLCQGNISSSSVENIVSIDHILTSQDTTATYCIKAYIKSILPQEHSWYMACDKCRRKTDKTYKTVFLCQGCKQENAIAEPWFCIRVEVTDNTGSICAVIFGYEAEKVLSCKAESIMSLSAEENFDQLEQWMTDCVGKAYVFRTKFSKARNVNELRIMTITDVD